MVNKNINMIGFADKVEKPLFLLLKLYFHLPTFWDFCYKQAKRNVLAMVLEQLVFECCHVFPSLSSNPFKNVGYFGNAALGGAI